MLADDDVARLDVPVQDAAAVGVVDGVADVGEPPQELAQLQRPLARVGLQSRVAVEPLDRLLEAVALDEPHRVVRAAVAVRAQPVDRHDPGVFEPAGDLGLDQEPLAAGRVVGVVVEDLLERHLAIQLGVEGHEHGPQPAPGMRPEHAEPLAVAGGRSRRRRMPCGRRRRPRSRRVPRRRGRAWPRCPGRRSAPGSPASTCRPEPRPGFSRRRRRAA